MVAFGRMFISILCKYVYMRADQVFYVNMLVRHPIV